MRSLSQPGESVHFLALAVLLLCQQVVSQNKLPSQSPPPQVQQATPLSDREKCKEGDATGCSRYGASLASQCNLTSGQPSVEKLTCAQKSQCYTDQSLMLFQYAKDCANATAAATQYCTQLKGRFSATEICDAVDARANLQLVPNAPVATKTFIWPNDIRAGDCDQQSGTLTIRADGTLSWEAVTYTYHTHSGDIWRAGFTLMDKDGVSLGYSGGYHDSPRMSDGNGTHPRYRWTFDDHFDGSKFDAIVSAVEGSKC